MSRREMLGMAGVAAIGLLPVARAVESSVLGPMECTARRGRVAFAMGGVDRWVIDANRFAGSPDLQVEKADGLIKFRLVNARYPGTDLPADMACEVRRGLAGWQMTLKMKLGGFEATVPFERWLVGRETARSSVRIDGRVCELEAESDLVLEGAAEAEFGSDWTLSLNGRDIARLRADGEQVNSDSISISLMRGGEPSLITKPAPKRTLVVMRRGTARWAPRLFVRDVPEDWRISADRCAFDAISLELGEHKTGIPKRTLLAESIGDDTRFQVQPLDWNDLRLPLKQARYSTTFGKAQNHRALLARFGDEPAWMELDGCSMQLGDSPETPDFEVSRVGQRQHNVTCVPALLAFVAPLVGAVTSTAKPTKPTNVDVSGRKTPAPTRTAPSRETPKTPVKRRPAKRLRARRLPRRIRPRQRLRPPDRR